MSASGQYQTTVDSSPGYIYISSDYGATWRQRGLSLTLYDVAMSASGQYQTAVDNNSGYIYISSDYGSTWTSTASSQKWREIAISASGQYQVVGKAGAPRYIYVSSDYGHTWTIVLSTGSHACQGLAISASGQYITGVINSGRIVTCYNSISSPGILYGTTGTFSATVSAAAYNPPSDYRIKENVQDLNLTDYTVNDLRPVNYHNKLLGKPDIGFIAHEVQEHYPFLVSGEKDGPQYQSLNYTGLIGIAVKEIKEIKEQTRKMNLYLELNEKLTTLGDIDLCGNYLTNIEGFHFIDGSTQKTGFSQSTFESSTMSFDIYEIKQHNYYINKSPTGLITWNIYHNSFINTNNTNNNNSTIFYFINSTGDIQHFCFLDDQSKINVYDSENNQLDITNTIKIQSKKIYILYTNDSSFGAEMYILNK
jgi:hypothetical protein